MTEPASGSSEGAAGGMRFFRNALSVFATNLGNVVVGVGTSVVLARWLSVEDRGIYSVATAFSGVVLLLAALGWQDAAIYRLRRVAWPPARVAGAALLAFLVLAGAAIGVCMLVQPWVTSRFLHDAPATVYFLALASFPFRLLGNVFAGMARALDRFALMNVFRLGTNAVVLVALVGVLVLGQGGLLHALAAVAAVRAGTTLVFVTYMVVRHTGITLRIGMAELLDTGRFGLKSYLAGLAGEVHEQVDVFMIAYLLPDPRQVAWYTIAVTVTGRLKLAPEAIGSALYPKVAGLPPVEAARFVAYVSRQSLSIVLAMVLAVGPLAGWLVPFLFGEAYLPSVLPLRILLPAMAAHTVYRVLTRWFTAVDRQQATIATQLVALPTNVALNAWWIPLYGIRGAALASLVSYTLETVLLITIFRRVTGTGWGQVLVPRRSDAAAWLARLRSVRRRLGSS